MEVHSLVGVACHHGILAPVSHLVAFGAMGIMCGQFALLAGCCHVQLGQSLEGTDGV